MDKEVFDKIEDLRRLVRTIFPSAMKKSCVESATHLFNTYINELDELLKNYLID